MNKTETANQLRLAAEILETGHPFEACRARHGKWDANAWEPCSKEVKA